MRPWPASCSKKTDVAGPRFRGGGSSELTEVAGVVQDGKYMNLTETPRPALVLAATQNYDAEAILIVRTSAPELQTAAELCRTLNHELCHVRRRDNLTAALHMLIESIFWFHPFVWWIGRRLIDERERACDEDVIHLGNVSQEYAKESSPSAGSPMPCASGVTGAGLRDRDRLQSPFHPAHSHPQTVPVHRRRLRPRPAVARRGPRRAEHRKTRL